LIAKHIAVIGDKNHQRVVGGAFVVQCFEYPTNFQSDQSDQSDRSVVANSICRNKCILDFV
jgi:hypothetical protein